jgi:hypothetical protein
MQTIATGYANDQTSSQTQKKFSTKPTRKRVVANVILSDIKKPITREKTKLGKFIIFQ